VAKRPRPCRFIAGTAFCVIDERVDAPEAIERRPDDVARNRRIAGTISHSDVVGIL